MLLQAKLRASSQCGSHSVVNYPMADARDSGGALITKDLEVIGMNLRGVGYIKYQLQQKKDLDEELTAVEEFVDGESASVNEGCVVLMSTAFPAL